MSRLTIILVVVTLILCFAAQSGGERILLVADQVDGVSNLQYFTSYYQQAIIDAGSYYTLWDHSMLGSPQYSDLAPYNVVIWFFGNSCGYPASNLQYGHQCLSLAEETTLQEWLQNSPGNRSLALFGMYAAYNCIADANNRVQYFDPLFSFNMALSYPDDNFDDWIYVENDWTLVPINGDVIMDLDGDHQPYDLYWRSYLNYPDQLEPRSDVGGIASAEWNDNGTKHHQAVIRHQGNKDNGGVYKTVLFACALENFYGRIDRSDIMENMITWFNSGTTSVQPKSLGGVKALYR